MPTIITLTGEANLKNSSAKISIFHSPKNGGMERYLSQAAKLKDAVIQRGSPIFIQSVQGVLKEIGGVYVNCAYEVRSGELVKLFAKVKYGYGRMDKVGSMFIRVRDGAAYRSVTIKTLDVASLNFREAKIEGCFDLVSLEEAIADGVKVKRDYFHMYNPELLSSIVETRVLQPELLPAVKKQVVELTDHSTGKKVEATVVKRRRAISL